MSGTDLPFNIPTWVCDVQQRMIYISNMGQVYYNMGTMNPDQIDEYEAYLSDISLNLQEYLTSIYYEWDQVYGDFGAYGA